MLPIRLGADFTPIFSIAGSTKVLTFSDWFTIGCRSQEMRNNA